MVESLLCELGCLVLATETSLEDNRNRQDAGNMDGHFTNRKGLRSDRDSLEARPSFTWLPLLGQGKEVGCWPERKCRSPWLGPSCGERHRHWYLGQRKHFESNLLSRCETLSASLFWADRLASLHCSLLAKNLTFRVRQTCSSRTLVSVPCVALRNSLYFSEAVSSAAGWG